MNVQEKFWSTFERVLGIQLDRRNTAVSELEEWDSLRHVELIFELEEEFEISVSPNEIADLFSDTDTVISFLAMKTGSTQA